MSFPVCSKLAELREPQAPWTGCPHGGRLAGLGFRAESERRGALVSALEPREPGRLAGPFTVAGLRPVRQRLGGVDRRALKYVRGHLASPRQPTELVAVLVETDAGIGGAAILPGVHVVDERHLRPRQRRCEVAAGHPVRAFGGALPEVGLDPPEVMVERQPGGACVCQKSLVLLAVRVQSEPERRRARQRHTCVRDQHQAGLLNRGIPGHPTDGVRGH